MKQHYIAAAAAIALIALFPACEGKKPIDANTGAITVVTTNFPPYDFVRAVAGDTVQLSMLLPPASESHSFEPTPRDIIAIQNSALFIYGGGESDTWVDRILESMDTTNMKIIRMMDAVDVVEEEIVEGMEDDEDEHEADETAEHDHEAAAYDEHVWTSPQNAARIVRAITDALCAIDGANAALFRQNAKDYTAQLDALDKEFQAVVDGARRKTIVFGDRFPFRYFADRYGLSYYAAFPGCSTETEPSAATVAFLINKIKVENIPVIFHIELSNEKMADAISEAAGAKKLLLHSAHNISKKDFERGVTYADIMRGNITNLREALR